MNIISNFLFVVLLAITHTVICDVYTSVEVLKDVINLESKVVGVLEKHIQSENERLGQLKRFANKLKQQNNLALKDTDHYLENPLNIYLLLKRLVIELQEVEDLISFNNRNQTLKNLNVYKNNSNFPTTDDFNGSIGGLTLIQDVYQIDTTLLASGNLHRLKYDTKLNSWDCLQIGKYHYEENNFNYAYRWFKEAEDRLEDKSDVSIDRKEILEQMISAAQKMGETSNTGYSFSELEKQNSGLSPDNWTEEYDKLMFGKFCREELSLPIEVTSRLKCKYVDNNNPFLLIAPFKVEELSINPKIVRFYNVMADQEIEELKLLSLPQLDTAMLTNTNGSIIDRRQRVGKVAWFPQRNYTIATNMNRRITDMTGLITEGSEPLQVCNYGVGGHFSLHVDYMRQEFLKDSLIGQRGYGNRMLTLLFYMNNVSQGGQTVFPAAKVVAKPVKGSAVVWYNLRPSGDGDAGTLHASCPVLTGTKWVSNKWLYEYGQEFLRPCQLDRFAAS